MTTSNMTCEAFDAALSDHLEGTLVGEMRARVEQHLRECVRCASLVRDLNNISNEAAALPDLVPSRDLWAGIESRIAAPVIPLTVRADRQKRFAPAWMGVAAAALVVGTAGVTYLLTARSLTQQTPTFVAHAVEVAEPSQANATTSNAVDANASATEKSGESSGQSRFAQNPTRKSAGTVNASLVNRDPQQVDPRPDALYGKEIEMLQTIVRQRRTQLDSSTVAVIERNLQIIDAAIAQSRAALAKDPASMLLSQQLSHALDKKVELLRTAAMLPAST
jgi:Putative zinc-finger